MVIDSVVAENLDENSVESVKKAVASLLNESAEEIDENENLIDRGLDSVRIMALVEMWRLKVPSINFMQLVKEPTITAWWKLLSSEK